MSTRGTGDTVYANDVQSEYPASLCASEANTGGGPSSFREATVVLKMAIEKSTTHATWTQPSTDQAGGSVSASTSNVPLMFTKPNHLMMPDIVTENIFNCITRCLIIGATISAK